MILMLLRSSIRQIDLDHRSLSLFFKVINSKVRYAYHEKYVESKTRSLIILWYAQRTLLGRLAEVRYTCITRQASPSILGVLAVSFIIHRHKKSRDEARLGFSVPIGNYSSPSSSDSTSLVVSLIFDVIDLLTVSTLSLSRSSIGTSSNFTFDKMNSTAFRSRI